MDRTKLHPTLPGLRVCQREVPGDRTQKRKADFIPHKGVLILVSKISQEAKRSPEAAQPSPTQENKIEPLPPVGNKSRQKDRLSGTSLSSWALGHWEGTHWARGGPRDTGQLLFNHVWELGTWKSKLAPSSLSVCLSVSLSRSGLLLN